MVALLHPTPLHPTPVKRTSAPSAAQRPARHLRLVETSSARTADPFSIAAVVGVMAMVLLVVLVRGVQGAPPAEDWTTLSERPVSVEPASVQAVGSQAVGSQAVGGQTVTVLEGDTWASIAARVSPGVDPVEFARSVASTNGGYQLQVGQVLQLADAG